MRRRQTLNEIMKGVDHTSAKVIARKTAEYTTSDGKRVIRMLDTDVVTFYPDGAVLIDFGKRGATPVAVERINDALRDAESEYEAGIGRNGSAWLQARGRKYHFESRIWFKGLGGNVLKDDGI